MGKILVSGMINIENTLKIDKFPLEYFPVCYPFFGIKTTVSGVGYNISKALTILGDKVDFLSIVGKDVSAKMVYEELIVDKVDRKNVLSLVDFTASSIIIYDSNGKREIHCDLKNLQETVYPIENYKRALDESSIALLCNINFSRPFLSIAKEKGKIIATDVHAISDINDDYNSDFMRYADILFLSNEHIKGREEDFVSSIAGKYKNKIIVTGLGDKGALLYVRDDNFLQRFNAVYTRPVVNTIGAGDALYSSFVHFYNKTKDPYSSLKKAIRFASYKIGEANASEGFLTENELERLC